MRRSASQPPRSVPKRPMAVIAYSEQLGTNRHRGPSSGLIANLYPRNRAMRKRSITVFARCGTHAVAVAAVGPAGYNSALSRTRECIRGNQRTYTHVAVKKPAKKAAKAASKTTRKPAAKKAPAKPAKKAPAQKTSAKKAAAKKPVAKKAPARKAPAKKAAPARKPAAKAAVKKVAAKKAPAKAVAKPAKKATPAKPVAKKAAAATKVAPIAKPAAKPEKAAAPVASAAPAAAPKTVVKPAAASKPAAKAAPQKPAQPAVSRSPVVSKPVGKVAVAVTSRPAAPAPKSKVKVVPYDTDDSGRPIVPKGYKPSADEEYMGPLQLEYFRQRLLQWRADLVEESKQTIENLKDEVRDIGDEAERATRETENSLELRTRDRYRKLIGKIDSTLKRVDSGEYGYSVDSGEEIGLDRLEARLTAERTIDEQERWEHLQKQIGD
jgi:DnaK suppressor protein